MWAIEAVLDLISLLLALSGTRKPNRLAVVGALKIAVLVFAAIAFLPPSSLAFHLTLEWDPNVDEDIGGYIVYYGTVSRNYKYDVSISVIILALLFRALMTGKDIILLLPHMTKKVTKALIRRK